MFRLNSAPSPNSIALYLPSASAPEEGIPHNLLKLPSAFNGWNAIGSIDLQKSFESHPTLKINLEAPLSNKDNILESLRNGTEVYILGMKWLILSTTFTEHSPQKYRNRLQLSISLVGIHASHGNPNQSKLDEPIRVLKAASVGKRKYNRWLSVQELANKLGIVYRGSPIYKRITSSTSSEEVTTVRQEIEEKCERHQEFIYYSNPNEVEGRKWGKTTVHYINDIYNQSIQKTRSGFGAIVNNTQLIKEYRNVEWLPDYLEKTDNEKPIVRWEFRGDDNFIGVQNPSEPVALFEGSYYYRYPSDEILNVPDLTIDNGGRTKEAVKITEWQGTKLEEEKWVYGFVYSSLDTHQVSERKVDSGKKDRNGSPIYKTVYSVEFVLGQYTVNNAWQQVEYSKTKYYHDKEGYLDKIETTGEKVVRFKTESVALEAINSIKTAREKLTNELAPLQEKRQKVIDANGGSVNESTAKKLKPVEEAIAALELEIEALLITAEYYRFDRLLPIAKTQTYSLDSYDKHYDDILPSKEDDWVEPRYVKQYLSAQKNTILVPDPNDTEEVKYPPLKVGRNYLERSDTKITSIDNPERFTTTNFTSNQEGEDLRNTLTISNSVESLGRPNLQSRINKLQKIIIDNKTESFFDRANKEKRYYFNSAGVTPIQDPTISTESIRFTDVFDLPTALKIAKYRLDKENTLSAESFTISTKYDPSISEGDLVVLPNDSNRYLVIGINTKFKIQGVQIIQVESFELELGKLLSISVNNYSISRTGSEVNNILKGTQGSKLVEDLVLEDLLEEFNNGNLTTYSELKLLELLLNFNNSSRGQNILLGTLDLTFPPLDTDTSAMLDALLALLNKTLSDLTELLKIARTSQMSLESVDIESIANFLGGGGDASLLASLLKGKISSGAGFVGFNTNLIGLDPRIAALIGLLESLAILLGIGGNGIGVGGGGAFGGLGGFAGLGAGGGTGGLSGDSSDLASLLEKLKALQFEQSALTQNDLLGDLQGLFDFFNNFDNIQALLQNYLASLDGRSPVTKTKKTTATNIKRGIPSTSSGNADLSSLLGGLKTGLGGSSGGGVGSRLNSFRSGSSRSIGGNGGVGNLLGKLRFPSSGTNGVTTEGSSAIGGLTGGLGTGTNTVTPKEIGDRVFPPVPPSFALIEVDRSYLGTKTVWSIGNLIYQLPANIEPEPKIIIVADIDPTRPLDYYRAYAVHFKLYFDGEQADAATIQPFVNLELIYLRSADGNNTDLAIDAIVQPFINPELIYLRSADGNNSDLAESATAI
ncbi:MAG: hypothetical protein ACRDBG_15830 [Waterburya sp.]